jgi:phytoene dehydrogenase-like protein
MGNPKLLIVGGGLAGLSAGCYARVNNFDVTIVEHNLELGGVCHARDGWEATLFRDMKRTADSLRVLAPEDADELARMVEGAEHAAALSPPLERAPELATVRARGETLASLSHPHICPF